MNYPTFFVGTAVGFFASSIIASSGVGIDFLLYAGWAMIAMAVLTILTTIAGSAKQ